jgi:ParB family chromosome partitioning protein
MADTRFEAEQDKRRKDEAQSNATGARVLQTIAAAVPVRVVKCDLLFIAEQILPMLNVKRVQILLIPEGSVRKRASPPPSCEPPLSAKPTKGQSTT